MRMSTFLLRNRFLSSRICRQENKRFYFNTRHRVEIYHIHKMDDRGNEYRSTGIQIHKNNNWQSWGPVGHLQRPKGHTKDLWTLLRALADPSLAPALAGIADATEIMEELLK